MEVKNPLDEISPNLKAPLKSTAVVRPRITARNILEDIGMKRGVKLLSVQRAMR